MLTSTTTTTAELSAVWRWLSDLEAWAAWLPTIDSVRVLAPGHPGGAGVGSSYLLKQPGLPPMRWTVTAWDPESSFTWESRSPGARTIGTHRLRRTPGDGTEITLTIEWVGPLARAAELLAGRKTQRFIDIEAKTLAEKGRSS